MRSTYLLLAALFAVPAYAQILPAPAQSGPIAIVGATAHIGDGTVISNAVVAFADGKITYAGARDGAPDLDSMEQIDATGKDVYPGFIAMDTRIGLVEIDAVRATDDTEEVGYFNPNARSLIAFNTDSEIIPTVRNIGVLTAQVTPDGEGLAGQSSAMSMDGWNWEDAAVGTDEGMHLHWPSAYNTSGWWAEPGGTTKNEDYDEEVARLEAYFEEASSFTERAEGSADNLRFESLEPVFSGVRNLYVHVSRAREIEDALAFCDSYGVTPVLVGAEDAYLVMPLLVERGVSVVCAPVHALPDRADDLVSQPFETPAELQAAGIPIAFSLSGAWEQRRVPHHAGHAVGFGLPYEEAIKALTLTPATLMGIDDRLGTLAVGKDATLFINPGDPLDMRTNKLERAFIGGREIDLDSRQRRLARKYEAKYERGEE